MHKSEQLGIIIRLSTVSPTERHFLGRKGNRKKALLYIALKAGENIKIISLKSNTPTQDRQKEFTAVLKICLRNFT